MSLDLTSLIESGQFVCLLRFPGYGVSADGRVWCCLKMGVHKGLDRMSATWREKKRTVLSNGYFYVNVGHNNPQTVHSLVLEGFVGPRPPGMDCCHADHDRTNPRLENLRWDTRKANVDDSRKDGRIPRGENRHTAKLSDAQVAEIREIWRTVPGATRLGLGKTYGVCPQTIGDIVMGRTRT